jgi:adenylate cyclase
MDGSRPTGAAVLPLAVLVLAVLALALNLGGIAAALRAELFAAWQGAAHAAALRPGWAIGAEAFWLGLVGVAAILLMRHGLAWTAALLLIAMLGGFWFGWFLFAARHLALDAASPAVGLALVLAAAIAAHLAAIARNRAALHAAFAESLPRASIEKIARDPALLKVDGEIRDTTYLVCGVRGLADVTAAFRDDPKAYTAAIQKMLTPLMDQALAHGGTIDRLTADGFAAFWNAPLADHEHALHACEAANGMAIMAQRVTENLLEGPTLPAVEIGVGIASGSVIAGGFGGHGRMGYSVSGEAVALAGRIQALSRQYGPSVIVADPTRIQAERGFAFLEVDTIADEAGAPVTLYAMLGNSVVRASPKFRALTTFHDHIFQAIRKQQWQVARQLIAQCRRLSGASPQMYDLHLARIAWYERNPPGPQWDGAFRPVLK